MLKKDHDFLSSVICFLPRVTISLIPVFSPFFRFPSHQMSIYKEQRYPSLNFPVPNIKLAPVCLPIEQGLLLLVWSCAQRLAFLWFSILNIICVQIYSASQLLFRKKKKTTKNKQTNKKQRKKNKQTKPDGFLFSERNVSKPRRLYPTSPVSRVFISAQNSPNKVLKALGVDGGVQPFSSFA